MDIYKLKKKLTELLRKYKAGVRFTKMDIWLMPAFQRPGQDWSPLVQIALQMQGMRLVLSPGICLFCSKPARREDNLPEALQEAHWKAESRTQFSSPVPCMMSFTLDWFTVFPQQRSAALIGIRSPLHLMLPEHRGGSKLCHEKLDSCSCLIDGVSLNPVS